MSVLIIGGDKICSLKAVLSNLGATKIKHWSGRKETNINKKGLPKVDCLVMLTSFLNHNTMYKFKKEAKKRSIPFICAKRDTNSITEKFTKIINIGV